MGMTTTDQSSPPAETVLISAHAAEQYRHRFRPGLDPDAARAELERLRATGEISTVAPAWLNAAKPAPHYLLLGDDVVLPVLLRRWGGWIATTCVGRQTLAPTRRAAKSARKKSLLASRRSRRRTRL